MGFPGGSVVKNPPTNVRNVGSVPGLGSPLEKEMATHSSILAWKIPWTEGLVDYGPWGPREVDMAEAT